MLDGRQIHTLPRALAVFARQPSVRLLTAQLVGFLLLRLWVGDPSRWDLVVVLAVALEWPLQEWWMHRALLHMRPRTLPGTSRVLDPLFARVHRVHHRAPHDLHSALLPMRVLAVAVPVHIALWWCLMPSASLALTGMIAYGAAALIYEWIHFLTHTAYVPRSRYFKAVRRGHRYHHYKNERYWFAFTVPAIDRALNTAPAPNTVPTSATARALDRG